MSENYSATYPAEQAGIFLLKTYRKLPLKCPTSDIVRGLFLLDNKGERKVTQMDLKEYPRKCHRNIRRLCTVLCTDAETAYAMILLTAVLADLHPEDEQVVGMIMDDCNVEVSA